MRVVVAGVVIAGSVLMAIGLPSVGAQEDAASKPEFYTTKVQPILETNCYKCHAGMFHRGGLNLKTREAMLQGGHHGAAVVPGDTSKSLLVKVIRHEGPANDPMDMPPHKPKLSDADIATVEQWVKAGAVMPADASKP